jgi:hypothetical protein
MLVDEGLAWASRMRLTTCIDRIVISALGSP